MEQVALHLPIRHQDFHFAIIRTFEFYCLGSLHHPEPETRNCFLRKFFAKRLNTPIFKAYGQQSFCRFKAEYRKIT